MPWILFYPLYFALFPVFSAINLQTIYCNSNKASRFSILTENQRPHKNRGPERKEMVKKDRHSEVQPALSYQFCSCPVNLKLLENSSSRHRQVSISQCHALNMYSNDVVQKHWLVLGRYCCIEEYY